MVLHYTEEVHYFKRVKEAQEGLSQRRDNVVYAASKYGLFHPTVEWEIDRRIESICRRGKEIPDVDFHLVNLALIQMGAEHPTYYLQDIIRQVHIDLWIMPGEKVQCYWTENHMINFLSVAHVLNMHTSRMTHCLQYWLTSRARGGFTELHSSSYLPITLEALCLLYLHSSNEDIKGAAALCLERLLWGLMAVTPVSGSSNVAQNRWPRYKESYGHNINSLMWLLTGRGRFPSSKRSRALSCILSSENLIMLIGRIVANFEPPENGIVSACPSYMYPIPDDMNDEDKMMFRWANGEFFTHPDDITIVRRLRLQRHVHLKKYNHLILPMSIIPSSIRRHVLQHVKRSPVKCVIYQNGTRRRQVTYLDDGSGSTRRWYMGKGDSLPLSVDLDGCHLFSTQTFIPQLTLKNGIRYLNMKCTGPFTLMSYSSFSMEVNESETSAVVRHGNEMILLMCERGIRMKRRQNAIQIGYRCMSFETVTFRISFH